MSTAIREFAECLPSEGGSFRESARAFRTIFETMASAIFICRGKFLSYVNRSAEAITGYTREELNFHGFLRSHSSRFPRFDEKRHRFAARDQDSYQGSGGALARYHVNSGRPRSHTRASRLSLRLYRTQASGGARSTSGCHPPAHPVSQLPPPSP